MVQQALTTFNAIWTKHSNKYTSRQHSCYWQCLSHKNNVFACLCNGNRLRIWLYTSDFGNTVVLTLHSTSTVRTVSSSSGPNPVCSSLHLPFLVFDPLLYRSTYSDGVSAKWTARKWRLPAGDWICWSNSKAYCRRLEILTNPMPLQREYCITTKYAPKRVSVCAWIIEDTMSLLTNSGLEWYNIVVIRSLCLKSTVTSLFCNIVTRTRHMPIGHCLSK